MFRISTMDGFKDIMYTNMYGCLRYGYEEEGWPPISACTDSKGSYVLSALFFIIFTIISSLVLLSLFLGVVTMSMEQQNAMHDLERRREESLNNMLTQLSQDRELGTIFAHQEEMMEEVKEFKKVFATMDPNGNGELDLEEWTTMLQRIYPNIDEQVMRVYYMRKRYNTAPSHQYRYPASLASSPLLSPPLPLFTAPSHHTLSHRFLPFLGDPVHHCAARDTVGWIFRHGTELQLRRAAATERAIGAVNDWRDQLEQA
jgi:hypothetical protein